MKSDKLIVVLSFFKAYAFLPILKAWLNYGNWSIEINDYYINWTVLLLFSGAYFEKWNNILLVGHAWRIHQVLRFNSKP